MRLRVAALALVFSATALARLVPPPIPPGRQHRLTIEGENTVNFLPRAGLPPVKVDYRARIEYIVDTRLAKEPRAQAEEGPVPRKARPRSTGSSARSRAKDGEGAASKATGAVDLSLHSSEMTFRQDGRTVLESRMTRSRFQGRLQPDAPVLSVPSKDAPPQLQERLKNFDAIAASLLFDDDLKVIHRRYRVEGPQRAIIETILSMHAPIPRGGDSWEAPTQLAMGHGQTARGRLRFEKDTEGVAGAGDIVKVKVSGVLKAEGIVAGNFIKDGTYTVTGEQSYDTHTREWTSVRWSVAVANELANQAGLTVAQARGTMLVESRAVDATTPAAPGSTDPRL
jgi:hypothetical protein